MKGKIIATIDQLEALGFTFQEACEVQGQSFQFRSMKYLGAITGIPPPEAFIKNNILIMRKPNVDYYLWVTFPPSYLEMRGLKQLDKS